MTDVRHAARNGDVSFWWNQLGRPVPRAPLAGSTRADVVIVGAGYTGLWTAYYLKKAAPQLRIVVRATEGFTAGLRGLHRTWLPMNSSLIATEPLAASVWASSGWSGQETLGDMVHAYMYAQRTSDDRIAIGGRGVPYRFGSKTDADGQTPQATVDALRDILVSFFPATKSARIDHAWSGVLGVPRDWAATVGLDPQTGLAWAGGYVGTGVATTNLAGRTLTGI